MDAVTGGKDGNACCGHWCVLLVFGYMLLAGRNQPHGLGQDPSGMRGPMGRLISGASERKRTEYHVIVGGVDLANRRMSCPSNPLPERLRNFRNVGLRLQPFWV